MGSLEKILVEVLSRTLYEIERHSVSLEKAFVRACSGRRCGADQRLREYIYERARDFIKNIIRLRCLYPDKSRKELARTYLRGLVDQRPPEPWCLYSVPRWFYERMRELLGEEETERLMKSLDNRVLWLRINTLKAPEERVLRSLENEGVVLERDRDLWYLYRVLGSRRPLREVSAVRNMEAVVQDKASCLVVESLRPERGERILDMAAAPGVKTSLIAMLTEDQARIVAQDVSRKRVLVMRHLLRRMGVRRSVDIVLTDSRSSPTRPGFFDKVLLDAPCSSTGAMWKDPGVRLSIMREGKIEYYSSIQRQLLAEALRMGRVVVYATCSLLPEEGELVVNSFRDRVFFERPLETLSPGYPGYDTSRVFGRTFPHRDLSEGFFIARLVVPGRG